MPGEEPGDGSVRVLHVDAESASTDAARSLERADDRLTVDAATDAPTGLERLDDGEFDCVVTAYDLPNVNGIDFLKAIRDTDPQVPVILYTDEGSEAVASEAISAGVTDYLEKESGSEQYDVLANRITNAVAQARAQQEIEDTRTFYRTILRQASDYVMTVDDTGTIEYISPGVERVMGYPPDELAGGDAFEFIHPDDVDVASEAFAAVLEDPDEEHTVTYRAQHADGSWRWLEVRGRNLLDDPVVGGVLVTARDVTERKERERELEQVRERMEFTLEGTDSVIYDVDLRTYEETRHGAFQRLYGLDPEAYSRTSEFYDAAIHPEDREKMRVFERTEDLRERDTVEWEYRTHPDRGKIRWLYSIADIRSGPDGDPTRAVGLVTDITELKERERQLERQNERLDEFAAIVSHDLRSPLSVASGHLELASEACESVHLDQAADALDRMETLIDDLLTLAQEGRSVGETQPVALADVSGDCWATVRTATGSLVVATEQTIRADPGRLKELLENLIRNAVDHAGEDVTVTVGALDEGFYVADDGPGIPEDARDAVFEGGYSTGEDGTGLGLAIVNSIAEAHDWTVRVTDSDAGGARFEITGVEIVD